MSQEENQNSSKKASIILSTDSLSWYWLDLIFNLAKTLNFDGIDLALRKNFDAWNVPYLKTLIEKYDMPIRVVQVSEKVNTKEINQALDICRELWADVISINSPNIFDITTFRFITSNINSLKRHNKNIRFCIINPPKSSFLVLPIPKNYFSNIVEIVKKHKAMLGFDVSNIDEALLETTFLRKLSNYIPYIWVVYISDKNKNGKWHAPLGEWVLKLPTIFKKFKQNEYYWYFSLKVNISKKDLADFEKVELILKKSKLYYKEYFEDIVIK